MVTILFICTTHLMSSSILESLSRLGVEVSNGGMDEALAVELTETLRLRSRACLTADNKSSRYFLQDVSTKVTLSGWTS